MVSPISLLSAYLSHAFGNHLSFCDRNLYDLQMSSHACGYCSTPLTTSPLIVPWSASTSSTPCPVRFCSRLCLSRSGRTHPLLCASRNPASAPLLHFARKNQWMGLHALAQMTARVLLTFQQDDKLFQEDWEVVRSLAQLGMEERAKGGWCVTCLLLHEDEDR